MEKVAIGSQNPVKISCIKKAFLAFWREKEFDFISISVPSGVNEQPKSDKECILGAKNRAKKALKMAKTDFGVGIEGGIIETDKHFFARAWVVIIDNKGRIGLGSSLSAPVPSRYMNLINKGIELGKANDIITGVENTKHKNGYFGFISDNLITREKGYVDAVVMALARFKKPEIFKEQLRNLASNP